MRRAYVKTKPTQATAIENIAKPPVAAVRSIGDLCVFEDGSHCIDKTCRMIVRVSQSYIERYRDWRLGRESTRTSRPVLRRLVRRRESQRFEVFFRERRAGVLDQFWIEQPPGLNRSAEQLRGVTAASRARIAPASARRDDVRLPKSGCAFPVTQPDAVTFREPCCRDYRLVSTVPSKLVIVVPIVW